MIKTLQNTLKQDKEQFTVPKSVQDAIPIRRIWPDGVFQFGSKFSKCIRFSDINYAIASKEDKTAMFLNYSELLNALDTGSTTKITINNKRLNRQKDVYKRQMRDIVKITEPGGRILDPFAGSGTTVLAAVLEGYSACLLYTSSPRCRAGETAISPADPGHPACHAGDYRRGH